MNTIYPREVVKAALKNNAAALIVAHNHPSGNLHPSGQDKELTKTLYLICSFMHITLLDHLIVGNSENVFSFADHGLMREARDECSKILGHPV